MHEFFDHTGDLGVRLRAESLDGLFVAAAEAFTDVICDPATIEIRTSEPVALRAADLELLLVDWLSELLYRFDTQMLLVRTARLTLSRAPGGHTLDATLLGETFDPSRHQVKLLVKAITYHGLKITQASDGWQADVIFDI